MLIQMTKTTKGSPNGLIVLEYKEGVKYDIPEKLYKAFKSIGVCKDVVEAPKVEEKAMQTPKNKMANPPDENKDEEVSQEDDAENEKASRRRRK